MPPGPPIGKLKPLWTCPRCGHRFVTRNLWHSCGNYNISDHFKGKDPILKEAFDKYVAIVRACGRATIYAQKTRIVFQVRVRFAGTIVKKHSLECGLWLTRRAEHPRLARVERYSARAYGHYFRIEKPDDLDLAFTALVREAYAVGKQEHLR